MIMNFDPFWLSKCLSDLGSSSQGVTSVLLDSESIKPLTVIHSGLKRDW